jgi:hypothetical protein
MPNLVFVPCIHPGHVQTTRIFLDLLFSSDPDASVMVYALPELLKSFRSYPNVLLYTNPHYTKSILFFLSIPSLTQSFHKMLYIEPTSYLVIRSLRSLFDQMEHLTLYTDQPKIRDSRLILFALDTDLFDHEIRPFDVCTQDDFSNDPIGCVSPIISYTDLQSIVSTKIFADLLKTTTDFCFRFFVPIFLAHPDPIEPNLFIIENTTQFTYHFRPILTLLYREVLRSTRVLHLGFGLGLIAVYLFQIRPELTVDLLFGEKRSYTVPCLSVMSEQFPDRFGASPRFPIYDTIIVHQQDVVMLMRAYLLSDKDNTRWIVVDPETETWKSFRRLVAIPDRMILT